MNNYKYKCNITEVREGKFWATQLVANDNSDTVVISQFIPKDFGSHEEAKNYVLEKYKVSESDVIFN